MSEEEPQPEVWVDDGSLFIKDGIDGETGYADLGHVLRVLTEAGVLPTTNERIKVMQIRLDSVLRERNEAVAAEQRATTKKEQAEKQCARVMETRDKAVQHLDSVYDALSDALGAHENDAHSNGADAVRTLAVERDAFRRAVVELVEGGGYEKYFWDDEEEQHMRICEHCGGAAHWYGAPIDAHQEGCPAVFARQRVPDQVAAPKEKDDGD